MSKIPLLLLLALAVEPPLASAAIYYVAPGGSDAGSGTGATPWRTIQKCANVAGPADACVVADGTYSENITLSRSGSPGSLIDLRSATTHGATVRGKVVVTGSYVKIEGFRVMIQDGGNSGIAVAGSNSEVVGNLISTDSAALGLNNTALGLSGNNNRAAANRIEKTCFGIEVSGTNHVVEGNDISALKVNGDCGDVDYVRFFGSGHVIRGNNLHGINAAEIGSAHVDCFQTFDNGGQHYSVTDVVLDGNSCSDAAQGIILEAKVYRQSRGVIIRNNVFMRVGAWCVVNMDVGDVRFYNNTCDTTGGLHGMWCRGTFGTASCEFKNNILYGTGTQYGVFESATLIDGTAASPGKNNLLFKPGATITGFSADIKNRDPLFLNHAASDYHITVGSPAKDAALAISTWANPTDKEGVSRPQGTAWDIGAFEWRGPAAPSGLRVVRRNSPAW